MTERSSLSILADLGTKLALPKIKESLKDITTGTKSDGFLNALANNLKARAGSWNAAATNIRQAIEALQIAEKALLEITIPVSVDVNTIVGVVSFVFLST